MVAVIDLHSRYNILLTVYHNKNHIITERHILLHKQHQVQIRLSDTSKYFERAHFISVLCEISCTTARKLFFWIRATLLQNAKWYGLSEDFSLQRIIIKICIENYVCFFSRIRSVLSYPYTTVVLYIFVIHFAAIFFLDAASDTYNTSSSFTYL